MKEQKKAKKVSWAPGANLCQLKYFKKADFQGKVGRQALDHSKLETFLSHQVVSDGGAANVNFQIPQVQWRTPPQFVLRSDWRVAAGEESEEREVQKHRETGVLEALYPHCSSIPPNPFITLNARSQLYDDASTPILSITPIEEKEEMDLSSSLSPSNISISSPVESLLRGLSTSAITIIPSCKSVSIPEPPSTGISALAMSNSLEDEVVITTVAAANAILKSKGLENLIDTDLLLLFLKNPELTQELFNKYRPSSIRTITDTGTSESKAFVHALQVPSSQLPIDKSDNKNSKPAKASSIIELSSSTHANRGIASGPKPVQPSVSLLGSTIDFFTKSRSHENNQPADGGNVAAMQIAEPLLAANAGKVTSSRPKQGIPSGSHTSNTCDLLTEKSTWSQSVSSTGHLTVKRPMNQSPAADLETGTCSQPKQVSESLSCPPSDSDLQSRKTINEQVQLENFGAGPGSAQKKANPSISLLMSLRDLPSEISPSEHNWQAGTRNVGVPEPVATQSVAADADSGSGIKRKAGTPTVSLLTSTHDFPAERSTCKQNQQVVTGNMVVVAPEMTQSVAENTRTQKGFRVKPGEVPMSVRDLHGEKSLNAVADLVEENQALSVPSANSLKNATSMPVAENQPLSSPKINAEFWGTPQIFGSSPDAKLIHVTEESLEISHFRNLIDEHGAHGKGGRAPVAGTNLMFPSPSKSDVKLFKKRVSEYGSRGNSEISLSVPSPVAMFDAFSPLREHRKPQQFLPDPVSTCPKVKFEPKIQKPCLYYNSRKGCRYGSSCRFLHDPSIQKQWKLGGVLEVPKTKRMKADRVLTGWT